MFQFFNHGMESVLTNVLYKTGVMASKVVSIANEEQREDYVGYKKETTPVTEKEKIKVQPVKRMTRI